VSVRERAVVCDECGGAKLIGRTPCPECRGTGLLPAEREEWRRRGDDCRTVREQMHQTLGDAAYALDLTAAAVARMEAGLDCPEPLERHWFRS